jgi:site-specific DNA-cytosine methylase
MRSFGFRIAACGLRQESLVIDLHAGQNFQHWTRGYTPCLTAARCKSKGYYVTRLSRCLTIADMLLLQGMRSDRIDWRSLNVPEGSFGHMIGNSMSVNVLERLLPRVLVAAGLLAKDKLKDWWKENSADPCLIKRRLDKGLSEE